MSLRTVVLLLAVGLLAAGATTARASTLIRRSLPELARDAEFIFVGRCESRASHYNDDRSLILTAYRFRVDRVLKGRPTTGLVLDELGGMVGDRGMTVAGTPEHQVGEEVLVFVHRTPLGRLATYGLGQGRFQITRDSRGRPWIVNDFYRTELRALAPPGATVDGAPLATFAARLQAILAMPDALQNQEGAR
jgi:hypothetical protein